MLYSKAKGCLRLPKPGTAHPFVRQSLPPVSGTVPRGSDWEHWCWDFPYSGYRNQELPWEQDISSMGAPALCVLLG